MRQSSGACLEVAVNRGGGEASVPAVEPWR